MSNKQDKKLRKMFRTQIRDDLAALTEKHTKEVFNNDVPIFKPKPKYMPTKLWEYLKVLMLDDIFLYEYNLRQLRKERQKQFDEEQKEQEQQEKIVESKLTPLNVQEGIDAATDSVV